MFSRFVSLSLLGLAAASPLQKRQEYVYPDFYMWPGFTLIANVTDLSTDLSPSVHNWVLGTAHTGAGTNAAILEDTTTGASNARLFYQNGTETEYYLAESEILTDGGIGNSTVPFGISVQKQDEFLPYPEFADEHGVSIDVGTGASPVRITRYPGGDAWAYMELMIQGQGSFVACRGRPVGGGAADEDTVTVEYVYATYDSDWSLVIDVPQGCTEIRLIPQCSALNDVPADAVSSHDYVLLSRCYESVSSIEWPLYGP